MLHGEGSALAACAAGFFLIHYIKDYNANQNQINLVHFQADNCLLLHVYIYTFALGVFVKREVSVIETIPPQTWKKQTP